jgi:DNA polymerase-3 subunit chi
MVNISFYHLLQGEAEKVAAKLLEKILLADMRVVVYAETTEKVEFLNSYFWTFSPGTFLPHGTIKEGMAEHQPIWITSNYENPNQAKVLMTLDPIAINDFGQFEKCLDIFNGHDPHLRTLADERLKAYKEAGYHLTYWQQDAQGKWVKQNIE